MVIFEFEVKVAGGSIKTPLGVLQRQSRCAEAKGFGYGAAGLPDCKKSRASEDTLASFTVFSFQAAVPLLWL